MLAKLFLLGVLCVSLVQVQGERDLQKTPDVLKSALKITSKKDLEEVKREAISVAGDIYSASLPIFLKQFKAISNIRSILASNATEYNERAAKDKERVRKDLFRRAEEIIAEAQQLGKPQVVIHCIQKVQENANKDVEDPLKTLAVQILQLNIEFNLWDFPEIPPGTIEFAYRHLYELMIKQIKNENDVEGVAEWIEKYERSINSECNRFIRMSTEANQFFFRHQILVYASYRDTSKKVEKIRVASFGDMRKCLDTRQAVFGKLLRFSKVQ